jgi:hypothetical protein
MLSKRQYQGKHYQYRPTPHGWERVRTEKSEPIGHITELNTDEHGLTAKGVLTDGKIRGMKAILVSIDEWKGGPMNQPEHDEMVEKLGDGETAEFFKQHVKSCQRDCIPVKRAQDMLANGLVNYSLRELKRFVRDVANDGS